jgi:hypothetical protein
MKTSELIGDALNRAAHTALQYEANHEGCTAPPYSSDWAFGGPIIEREDIGVFPKDDSTGWYAHKTWGISTDGEGPTPLIAAMRCYVASKLGDTIDIPEELI